MLTFKSYKNLLWKANYLSKLQVPFTLQTECELVKLVLILLTEER